VAEIGPLIDEDARLGVHRQVHDAVYAGAELRAGGEPLPGAGYFYPPTVLVDPPTGAPVLTEPLCGPVAAVRVVECLDAALAETGRCAAAAVLTPSAEPVWRRLDAATVSVNSLPPERPAADPGRLDELTRTKAVFL
jgi:acyl-CoA reductase-like NAD-dependent aldehyde dehydrogenase